MPTSRSYARRHWVSKRRSLRRRLPMFVTVLLCCLTGVAILLLVVDQFNSPASASQSQQRTPVPAAIR